MKARKEAQDRILGRLRALGDRELSLNECLSAIKAEGERPMQTLNKLMRYTCIKFVGEHRGDQRYRLS